MPITIPTAAIATLVRIRAPSMPKSSKDSPWWSISPDCLKTGSSQCVIVDAPNGSPSSMPSPIAGIASRIRGTVIVQLDSWIVSQIDFAYSDGLP